jgi:ATP-binding cassette, subfamily C (CFTR/MRP), member 1
MNSTVLCTSAVDDVFGPRVNPCQSELDFTLYFEQLILTIIPAAVFLLLACWRLRKLLRQDIKIVGGVSWLVVVKYVR